MALTPDEADLVRSSFRIVSQTGQESAQRFYEILFDLAPQTRTMFVNDLGQQGSELMSKLGLIVAELQNFDGLRPILEDLALRHVAYGVKPHHYALVGAALLQMLAEVVGDDFTPQTREAWERAYNDLSQQMIRSAYTRESLPGSL